MIDGKKSISTYGMKRLNGLRILWGDYSAYFEQEEEQEGCQNRCL